VRRAIGVDDVRDAVGDDGAVVVRMLARTEDHLRMDEHERRAGELAHELLQLPRVRGVVAEVVEVGDVASMPQEREPFARKRRLLGGVAQIVETHAMRGQRDDVLLRIVRVDARRTRAVVAQVLDLRLDATFALAFRGGFPREPHRRAS
jgi:hypothetical protein